MLIRYSYHEINHETRGIALWLGKTLVTDALSRLESLGCLRGDSLPQAADASSLTCTLSSLHGDSIPFFSSLRWNGDLFFMQILLYYLHFPVCCRFDPCGFGGWFPWFFFPAQLGTEYFFSCGGSTYMGVWIWVRVLVLGYSALYLS